MAKSALCPRLKSKPLLAMKAARGDGHTISICWKKGGGAYQEDRLSPAKKKPKSQLNPSNLKAQTAAITAMQSKFDKLCSLLERLVKSQSEACRSALTLAVTGPCRWSGGEECSAHPTGAVSSPNGARQEWLLLAWVLPS